MLFILEPCSADMILRYSVPSEEDKHKAVKAIYKDLPLNMSSFLYLYQIT
ncbi:hypothetical protein NYE25_12225 [Paenibacillus sp. FSL E2-8871]